MDSSFRVATYNVHGFVGGDKKYSPDRIFEVLKHLDANVIALQEVQADQSTLIKNLRDFALVNQYQLLLGPTILAERSHLYGNAVLIRGYILSSSLLDISLPHREPRGLIDIVTEIHGEPWRILATHLGLSPRERRDQVNRILKMLNSRVDNVVLLGDLNEWFFWGKPLRQLHRYFGYMRTPATFPARWPIFALDRIWIHSRSRKLKTYVINNAETRLASDHLPLVAQISYKSD